MKKKLYSSIAFSTLFLTIGIVELHAQAPLGINFQAVARQADGRPVPSKQISVRISIVNGSATGAKEYTEQHFPTTNSLGLFDLVIGKGNVVTGLFNNINWAGGNKWIQVEVDPQGGTSFILMGSQQLLSVPYAIYADYAANVIDYKGGQGINVTNDEIINTGDSDNDPTNELINSFELGEDNFIRIIDAGGTKEVDLNKFDNQPLGIADVLSIGNNADDQRLSNLAEPLSGQDAATKNYVDNLDVSDADADPTNEIQDLQLNNNTLTITNNSLASEIDLSTYLDNTDNQSLSLLASGTGRTISIDNGEGVTFSVADNDNDPENEIQDLQLTGNILRITNNASASNVDLSGYLDNTDSQTLGLSTSGTQRTIAISGGNQITLNVADNDNSSTNEAQTLSKSANEISLTAVGTTGGGTVILNDDDPANEIQDLQLTENTLRITNNASASNINLSSYLDNTDSQTLGLSTSGTQRTIAISGGNQITLNVADNDNSSTNEAQTLSKTDNQITLTAVGTTGGGTVILNDDDPTNEIQSLGLTGDNLNISGGAGVSLSAYRQNLGSSISGTNRTITISGGTSTIISVEDNDNNPLNELQNLSQVLAMGNSAGGFTISGLGSPINFNDAATRGFVEQLISQCNCGPQPIAQMSLTGDEPIYLESKSSPQIVSSTITSTNYAFSVEATFNGTGINRVLSLQVGGSTTAFDDYNVVNNNRFIAKEAGVYQFNISAQSSVNNTNVKVRVNGVQVNNIMRIGGNAFQGSLLLKLNANDYIEILADLPGSGSIAGSFFGYKL